MILLVELLELRLRGGVKLVPRTVKLTWSTGRDVILAIVSLHIVIALVRSELLCRCGSFMSRWLSD